MPDRKSWKTRQNVTKRCLLSVTSDVVPKDACQQLFANKEAKDVLTRKQINDARKQGVLAIEISEVRERMATSLSHLAYFDSECGLLAGLADLFPPPTPPPSRVVFAPLSLCASNHC